MAYKVIVFDRSPSVQKTLRLAFPEYEFEIYPFEDSEALEEAMERISPDAILLNVSVPGRDGYELAASIKSRPLFRKTPLILLKGAFDPGDKEKLAELKYDAVVREPFDSGKLVSMVRDFIQRVDAPPSFPEEPDSYEISNPSVPVELDENLKGYLRQEILQMERELEKRITARVLSKVQGETRPVRGDGLKGEKKKDGV